MWIEKPKLILPDSKCKVHSRIIYVCTETYTAQVYSLET